MTTRKINVAVTVTLEVAFDPTEITDAQAVNRTESAVYEVMRDITPIDSTIRMSYTGTRDVASTATIRRGNGQSIVTVRPMAFDEMLDNYNNNRHVSESEWAANYKEYSHLMRVGSYMMRELPWVGRDEMTKVWSKIVQEERDERESRLYRIVRTQILRHLDGAFEDGVESSGTDGQDAEPF